MCEIHKDLDFKSLLKFYWRLENALVRSRNRILRATLVWL